MLTFNNNWNLNNSLNLNDLLNLYIFGNLNILFYWNFNSDLNNFFYRNLNDFLLINWLFDYPLDLNDFFNNFFNRYFNELLFDDFDLYLFVYINWNLNDSFNWYFNFNIFVNLNIDILGHFNFSYYCLLVRNFDLLYDLYLFFYDSFDRYFYNSVHKYRNVDVLIDNFLDIFLNRIWNLDYLLNWNFLDLINMNLFVYINSHWDLLISFNDLLDSDRSFHNFINIDFFLNNYLFWHFDDLFKFYFFLNFNNSRDFNNYIFVLLNGNINNDFLVFLIILRDFIFYSLINLNLSNNWNFNYYFIFDYLSSMRSNDKTFMRLLNKLLFGNRDFRNVFFGNFDRNIIGLLNIFIDINSLLDLSIALSLNDFFYVHVSGLFDDLFNNVINIISVLDNIFNRLFNGNLIWLFDDFLNHDRNFFNQSNFLISLIHLVLTHYKIVRNYLNFILNYFILLELKNKARFINN